MTNEDAINTLITGCDTNKISDGYHTFEQLYEHRIILYIALCKSLTGKPHIIWRSKKHSDLSQWDGWFLLGIDIVKGHQITYHLPIIKWPECTFAETFDNAPDFDGHTGEDVLKRIAELP